MRSKTKAVVALSASISVLALGGCSAASDAGATTAGTDGDGVVAMSFAGSDIAIWNDTVRIMEELLADEGYALLTDDPQWRAENQVADWEAWIQRGDVQAIMGFPIQPDSLVPVTTKAVAAGIPVISYATPWEGATPGLMVDDFGNAETVARTACGWIEENTPAGTTRTVAVMGDRSTELSSLRIDGLRSGLEECADLVEVSEITGEMSREVGNANARAQLQANADTTVWLSGSDDLMKGAYQALIDSGIAVDDPNYYIGTLDATTETVELIAEGGIFRDAWIVTAQAIAELNSRVLLQAARGEEIVGEEVIFSQVTPANAAEFLE